MPTTPCQNLTVFADTHEYVVVGEIDRKEWYRNADAGYVLHRALDQVGRLDSFTGFAGGQVRLSRGRFPLSRPLIMPARTMLVGSGPGTKLAVTERAETGVCVHHVKHASVTDLSIMTSPTSPAKVGLDFSTAGNCFARGLYIEGFNQAGIRLGDSSFLCRISDCSLAGNSNSHLLCERLDHGPFGDWLPNHIQNCTIYGGGTGVRVLRSLVLNLSDLQIHQTQGSAFDIAERSNAVSIRGCRTYQITGNALQAEDSHELHLVGNVLSWHTEAGVVLTDCYWGTICGNNIIDTGSFKPGGPCMKTTYGDLDTMPPSFPGIFLRGCRGFSVTGNALFNWPVAPPMAHGIEEDEQSSHNVIADNNANYFRGYAARSAGRATKAQGNGGYGPTPLWGSDPGDGREPVFYDPTHAIQSFQPHRMSKFFDETRWPADPKEHV